MKEVLSALGFGWDRGYMECLQNFVKNVLGKWPSGISRRCCDAGS
jgi:hypothetical protein